MIDIRDEAGKLLMRYNPDDNLIEIQRRGVKTTIDLNQYRRSAMSDKEEIEKLRRDILQLKCSVRNNLIRAREAAQIDPRSLTIEECRILIENISLEYYRIKSELSATSATKQGGTHDHYRRRDQ